MTIAAAFVLVLWMGPMPAHCRPLGTVTGYELARYERTPPALLPAVEMLQARARRRGADTVLVTGIERVRTAGHPKWDHTIAVTGTAYTCGAAAKEGR